ncbi:unnamed protein product, partial [Mesorhabditis spiculigera]
MDSNPSVEELTDYTWVESAVEMISHILNGYLTAAFVITGVVLNLFSIFIFLRCERTGTPAIQYYLVTLTMWQTALLCNAFLLYSLPNLLYGKLISTGSYVHIYPYVYTFANTTHTGSVWIVLTLTIDRYLALCQPLKHRAIGKRSRVKRLMLVVSLLACLFSLPRFFEVHAVEMCQVVKAPNVTTTMAPTTATITADLNATRDDTQYICYPAIDRTALFDDRLYWSVYHIVLAMMFVTLCPCLLLCALTARISIELRNAVAQRRQLCPPNLDIDRRCKAKATVYSRKEHKANIMLVLVIAKFLISDILPTVADLLEHIVGKEEFMSSSMASLFVDISNFLLVLNCSSNFWVFIIWGKRFRKSVKNFLVSTSCGAALYKMTHFGSETDVTSVLIPTVSPLGAPFDTKRSQRTHLAVSSKCTEIRTYASTANTVRNGSSNCWDYEKNAMLQQLEHQRLLSS